MMDVQVPQPLFIGREDICKTLRLGVFTDRFDPTRRFCSLIGPNNIGKTYLIRHLSRELKHLPNVYYFETALVDTMTFGKFWQTLVRRFQRDIPEEKLRNAPHPDPIAVDTILNVYQFFQADIPSGEGGDAEAMLNLNDLFEYYTSLGIRIIITIDEFDLAMDLFAENRLFYDYLFSLSPKSGSQYNLSIVIISRRTAGTIADDKRGGSNFPDAFRTETLRGFSNAELEVYFDTYRELALPQELLTPEGSLSPEVRQKILFFCGRSPGLLMWMRDKIDEAVQIGRTEIDIARIAHDDNGTIVETYKRMCRLMREEKANRNTSSMNTFYQHFIGPVCDDEASHKENVKRLFDYGFITKTFAGEKDIFSLSGIQSVDDEDPTDDEALTDEDAFSYEPLSPHFVAYVKSTILNDDLTELGRLLEEVEREVRKIISNVLRNKLGKDWKLELEKFARPLHDQFAQSLMRLNTAGAEVSKLNVMSFREYYAIIAAHWTDMRSYFPCGRDNLRYIMVKQANPYDVPLCDARNVNGHVNREILGSVQRERLIETCKSLLQGMQNSKANPSAPALAQPHAEPLRPKGPLPTPEQINSLINSEVEILDLVVRSTGGLRGTISGHAFEASLSKACLRSHQIFNRSDYAGKSLRVKILNWDANGRVFIATFPES